MTMASPKRRLALVVTDDTPTQAGGGTPRPAATLFEGSFLSAAALGRELLSTRPTEVLIVSGKHGLVHEADVIAPYAPSEISDARLQTAVSSLRDFLASGDAVPILLLKSQTVDFLLKLPGLDHPGPVFFVGAESYAEKVRDFFGVRKEGFHAFRRVGVARVDAKARREIIDRLSQVDA